MEITTHHLNKVGWEKILENSVYKHVYEEFLEYQISPLQSSFTPRDSTVNQLVVECLSALSVQIFYLIIIFFFITLVKLSTWSGTKVS